MIRQVTACYPRSDAAGSGAFNAHRGRRRHRGRDYVCEGGALVMSPVMGIVQRNGRVYRDTGLYKIVNILDEDGLLHRLFYVKGFLRVGSEVDHTTPVGYSQNVTQYHADEPDMEPHVHYEIRDRKRNYYDPEDMSVFFPESHFKAQDR